MLQMAHISNFQMKTYLSQIFPFSFLRYSPVFSPFVSVFYPDPSYLYHPLYFSFLSIKQMIHDLNFYADRTGISEPTVEF